MLSVNSGQLTSKNKSIEDIILADIPKMHLEQITQIIKRVLIYNHIQATQIQLKQLIIHLIIIYKRQNISYKAWEIKPKSFEIANQCITEINNRLGYDLNRETTKLFSFFISDYFEQHDLGFEQLFVKSYIERLIVQMEQNIGVGFTQDSVLRDNIFSHFSRTYHRIIKNGFWATYGAIATRFLALVSNLLLARLLLPSEFGVISTAYIFWAFGNLFNQGTSGSFIVYKGVDDRRYLDTTYTISLGIGLLLAVVLGVISPLAAHYYRVPDLVWILLTL